MKNVYLAIICLLAADLAYGQHKNVLSGKVIDSISASPLEMATVAVVDAKDTSLISYTVTNAAGKFVFHNLPVQRPMKVIVSFVSYESSKLSLTLNKGEIRDVGVLVLSPRNLLKEAVATGFRSPVRMRKDTLEFDAESFKTHPNAIMEELLRMLPGVQINYDGSIIVNGKAVSKILIDGKQFFGGDVTAATRNLDAAMASKIQVYDDRENDPDHLLSETVLNKIIDIKLKKEVKKSAFGKAYAGIGTNERHEYGAMMNLFRDTLQVSLIGLNNNLNNTGFSKDEFNSLGGFNRGGGDALNNGSVSQATNNQYNGISEVTSAGVNLNNDFGKFVKLNVLYFYNQKQTTLNTRSLYENYLNDTTLIVPAQSYKVSDNYNHTISALLQWKINGKSDIRYTPRFVFGSVSNVDSQSSAATNNFGKHLNDNSVSQRGHGQSRNFQHDFYYHHSFKGNGATITISHALQVSPGKSLLYSDNRVQSYASSFPSDTLLQYYNNPISNTSVSLNINYLYPLTKKITAQMIASGAYNVNGEDLMKYNFNPKNDSYDIFLDNESTVFKRRQWVTGVKPGIIYNLGRSSRILAGVNSQWIRIDNDFIRSKGIRQHYYYLLPSIRIETGKMSISYDRSIIQPSIVNLQPVTTIYSSLYSFTGDPELKPMVVDNFGVNYFNYFPRRQIGLGFSINLGSEQNSVISAKTINAENVQAVQSENINGQYSMAVSGNINKKFNRYNGLQISLRNAFFGNLRRTANNINEVHSYQYNYSTGFMQGINVNYNEKIDFSSEFGFRYFLVKYNYSSYVPVDNTIFSLTNRLYIRILKNVIWEANQSFLFNSQIPGGFPRSTDLINSSLAYEFARSRRAMIKVTVFDIFDKNVGNYRTADKNSVYTSQIQVIRRYGLLTLQYKLSQRAR